MTADSEAQLVVARVQPLSAATRKYPLATREGLNLVMAMIAADQHWKPLSGLQREALRRAYLAAVAAVPADTPEGTAVEWPALSADVHAATRRSLQRRGLVADGRDGRLTALAVEVVQLADRNRRPVVTAPATEELL